MAVENIPWLLTSGSMVQWKTRDALTVCCRYEISKNWVLRVSLFLCLVNIQFSQAWREEFLLWQRESYQFKHPFTEERGQSRRLLKLQQLAGEQQWNLKAAAGQRLGCHQAFS